MPRPLAFPPNVRVVDSFDALLATPFAGEVNAVCWARPLRGDFAALAARLAGSDAVRAVEADELDDANDPAIATLQHDLRLLRNAGHAPSIELVRAYPRDDDTDFPTDVHSFHVDSATTPTETFLCTYAGAPTEGLDPRHASRRIDDPIRRRALLARFGGRDDAAFAAWLAEGHHDLHWTPDDARATYSFGTGSLWRLAVQWDGCPVAACIHRAPATTYADAPRLLLLS